MENLKCWKVEKENGITWAIMNRPEKRNSMSPTFFRETGILFRALSEDEETRVIILKGEGKSFSAGLDFMESASELQGGDNTGVSGREATKRGIMAYQESFSAIEKCRKPVIAAIHSHCIGGAVDLVCACDVRLCSKDVVFCIKEIAMAVIADLGTLQRMPYIVGESWFRELTLTCDNFGADLAEKMRFVTHVYDDKETLFAEAKKMAEKIAGYPPVAVQGLKDVLTFSRDNGVYPGLEYVAQKSCTIIPSEDFVEAFTAFMQKRKPVFKGK